jgi:hypothetical protein
LLPEGGVVVVGGSVVVVGGRVVVVGGRVVVVGGRVVVVGGSVVVVGGSVVVVGGRVVVVGGSVVVVGGRVVVVGRRNPCPRPEVGRLVTKVERPAVANAEPRLAGLTCVGTTRNLRVVFDVRTLISFWGATTCNLVATGRAFCGVLECDVAPEVPETITELTIAAMASAATRPPASARRR